MRFWRSSGAWPSPSPLQFFKRISPLRFCLGLLLSLVLATALHACQSPPAAAPIGGDKTATPTASRTLPEGVQDLPTETQAIVASAGPNGLFNPPRGDVRLAVISDLNGAYGSTDYDYEIDKSVALMPFWKPDMVLCSGDMVAGQKPTLTNAQLQAMWAAFDEHVAAPLREANLPYGFTMGNHDASGATDVSGGFKFERERTVASNYWNDPAHDPGLEFIDRHDFPFYYTFKYNDIFFMAWDGSSFKIPPAKLAWVEQALQSPEAQSAKMRVLIGHLPLYAVAVGRDKPGEVMANADDLRAMLEKYNVHTYISGHQHAYYPAHKGQLQLLHTGIIGSGPRPYVGSQLPPQKSMTVIDVNFEDPDLTTYTTYNMETLELIEYQQLPRYIAGHNGMVKRRDVDELTADEQAACENQLDAERCAV